MTDDRKLKRRQVAYLQRREEARQWNVAMEYQGRDSRILAPAVPPHLRLPCGAQTRAGHKCRIKTLFPNGRCRFHGGPSTGPKSDAGRARARANLKLRWANRNPVSDGEKP